MYWNWNRSSLAARRYSSGYPYRLFRSNVCIFAFYVITFEGYSKLRGQLIDRLFGRITFAARMCPFYQISVRLLLRSSMLQVGHYRLLEQYLQCLNICVILYGLLSCLYVIVLVDPTSSRFSTCRSAFIRFCLFPCVK